MNVKNIIDEIQNATTQAEIHFIIACNFKQKYESKIAGKVFKGEDCPIEVLVAEKEDSDYFVGDNYNTASDGKRHDFGKGKWSAPGDNVPLSLDEAKQLIIKTVKNFVASKQSQQDGFLTMKKQLHKIRDIELHTQRHASHDEVDKLVDIGESTGMTPEQMYLLNRAVTAMNNATQTNSPFNILDGYNRLEKAVKQCELDLI